MNTEPRYTIPGRDEHATFCASCLVKYGATVETATLYEKDYCRTCVGYDCQQAIMAESAKRIRASLWFDAAGNPIYAASPEWEHNGYHDSDFMQVGFCPATGELASAQIGTTRSAGGVHPFPALPEEHKPALIAALAKRWTERLVSSQARRINHPKAEEAHRHGTIELIKACHNRARQTVEVACYKCDGKGHWQNPRNPSDKRPCFGCNGTGKRVSNQAAKGQKMIKREIGLVCKVKGHVENKSQYGTWSYGIRLKLETVAGETFYAPLDSCKLHGLPDPTPEQFAERAQREAESLNVIPLFHYGYALANL